MATKTKPRTNSRTHLMTVRVPLWIAEQLQDISQREGKSLSELMIAAMEEYLCRIDREKFGIEDDIFTEGGTGI